LIDVIQSEISLVPKVSSTEVATWGIRLASERQRRLLQAQGELAALAVANERARIAADLHDDTIQVLTGSLLSIDRVLRAARASGTGVPTALTDARVLLSSTLDRTRRLMFEIRPPLLESHGVGHAVGELLDQMRRDLGIQAAVTIDVARLSPSTESLVYRTVQELVANARKLGLALARRTAERGVCENFPSAPSESTPTLAVARIRR